ncbi:hypothetical protein CDQ84_01620 [Clostridium thermosuccinogenes]|uniref:non-specific protein-tyrosine kinase n=1 Tax=Clostridium thermosuccinogenes TaxID=84032 RepID=A0A2K2FRI9_9CLOT|nr:hypothetical protein CDO33_04105 [Pseudoclostridium thermosuccinogenes]PNT99944.1 hypothetical protein CDQ85_01620 [Pseudoclostridium thermosuccinogenes]PNU01389.1 hypothetical protein CDQ84_01620 [Pseudoclostridium thermosuccinogenes]
MNMPGLRFIQFLLEGRLLRNEPVFNIELKDVLGALRRKFYIIIFLTVLSLALSIYYTKIKTVVYYETRASLMVGSYVRDASPQFNGDSIAGVLELMEAYRVIANTSAVAEKIIEKHGLNVTADEIKGLIDAVHQPETPYLDLTFSWVNSEEAGQILDTLIEAYINEVKNIFPASSIRVIDRERNPRGVGESLYRISARLVIGIDSASSATNPPQYRAANISSYQVPEEAFYAIAKTNSVAKKVIEKANLKTSTAFLKGRVSVDLYRNTPFLDVIIRWPDHDEAITVLNGFVETYIDEVKQFYPSSELKILEKDETPQEIVISRDRLYVTAGLAAGLVLSVLLIFAMEFMNDNLRTETDVESSLQLSVIGLIPEERRKFLKSGFGLSEKLSYAASEACKILRTNIYFTSDNARVIAVTSGMPGEGKTVTASSLAVALAQDNKKTILVDCNMRKPDVHSIFKTSEIGLSSILMNEVEWFLAIHKSEVENLSILAAGEILTEPVEALASDHMKYLIEVLRREFDYIILDTPPLNLVTDACVLSEYIDGYILVVYSGKSSRYNTLKAKKLLQFADGKILGIVLNGSKEADICKKYKKLARIQRRRAGKKHVPDAGEYDVNGMNEQITVFPSPKANES